MLTALRKKCPYSELFWFAFSRIRSEYGEILGYPINEPIVVSFMVIFGQGKDLISAMYNIAFLTEKLLE